jgi:RNA polymerase sigma factor (sigma-70 family)
MNISEEKQLVENARTDAESFVKLYDYYFPKVYSFIAAKVGNRLDAEDITSEVFMKALENLDKFEWRGKPFIAWLFTIARNSVNSFFKKSIKGKTSELDESRLKAKDKGPSPDKKAAEGELSSKVKNVLRKLPERESNVVQLKFFSQMNNREIVAATGLSESNVAIILYRTLRKIKPDLKHFV